MGQAECLRTLKKANKGKWLSAREIGEIQNQSGCVVSSSLKRLHKQGLILKRTGKVFPRLKSKRNWHWTFEYKLK